MNSSSKKGTMSEIESRLPAGHDDDVMAVGAEEPGVKTHVLGELQVLGQAVGMIGPSLGVAAVIPLIFATVGYASWLTVVIATVGMLAIAVVVSELARRHVSMGALYTLIPKGLGPAGGLLAAGGFGLIALCGQLIAILGFGFALAQFLESALGIGHSARTEVALLALGGLAAATVVSVRSIALSTKVLFTLEALSMTAICALLLVILVKHGEVFSTKQLALKGGSAHGILFGMSLLVLSFGGFEAAASLGFETKNPRRTIPRVLIGSIALVGVFFLVNVYIQILGFEGTGLPITEQAVPLGALADHYGVTWLGNVVLLGVSFSWFAALCAWINYAARPILTMADEGVVPGWLGRTDKKTGAPIASLLFVVGIWLAITLFLALSNIDLSEAFANIAALAGYGYTFLYLLVGATAIGYAIRHRHWKAWFVASGVIGGGVMVLEYWYSFNPLPPYPIYIYVYIFAGFVAALVAACCVAWLVAPQWLRRMGSLEETADLSKGLAPE